MPLWARKVFRGFVLLLLVYAVVFWAVENDAGWIEWSVICGLLGGWLIFRIRQFRITRDRQRESRWESATYDKRLRPRAIGEARAALSRVSPTKPRARPDFVRISLALTELLDADEQYDEAMAIVDRIDTQGLAPLDAGLVLHTQAVTHLRASDHTGASQLLAGRSSSTDRELDQRLELLDAYAQAEGGDPAGALTRVENIEADPGADPSVTAEARVVRAAAMAIQGEREDALVVLAAVGRASLEPISQLGLPRVRAMAHQILLGSSTSPGAL